MKNYLFILILSSFVLVGCENSGDEPKTTDTNHPLDSSNITENSNPQTLDSDYNSTEIDPGSDTKKDYREFYETGELKIEGDFDENEERHGIWVSYYENGIKWSESNYSHGKRLGHSITFFPNGRVRYVGEYANDKQIGHWIFYDEDGKVVKEEDY